MTDTPAMAAVKEAFRQSRPTPNFDLFLYGEERCRQLVKALRDAGVPDPNTINYPFLHVRYADIKWEFLLPFRIAAIELCYDLRDSTATVYAHRDVYESPPRYSYAQQYIPAEDVPKHVLAAIATAREEAP